MSEEKKEGRIECRFPVGELQVTPRVWLKYHCELPQFHRGPHYCGDYRVASQSEDKGTTR